MNKKGSIMDPIIWAIVSFVILVMFGFFVYLFFTLNDTLTSIPQTQAGNISGVASTVITPLTNNMASILNWIGIIMLIGGAISILVHNFGVKAHPIFYFTYIIGTILAIIISAYLSNEYMSLLSNSQIGTYLGAFIGGTFIMQWLPYFATVIGFLGAIIVFSNVGAEPGGVTVG